MLKKKISYVVGENYREVGHNSGINSLALDAQTPGGILYTAGKDSKIISWDLHLDDDNRNPYYVKSKNVENMDNVNNTQIYSSLVDMNRGEDTNNKIEYNESPDSQKDFSLLKSFHSDEITKNNSAGISIKSNGHKLKQKFSQNFDLRRKKVNNLNNNSNNNKIVMKCYFNNWILIIKIIISLYKSYK